MSREPVLSSAFDVGHPAFVPYAQSDVPSNKSVKRMLGLPSQNTFRLVRAVFPVWQWCTDVDDLVETGELVRAEGVEEGLAGVFPGDREGMQARSVRCRRLI